MSTDLAVRTLLLGIARGAITAVVRGEPAAPFEDAPILREERGAFVTLMHRQRLRGCIGRVIPDGPLARMLPEVAVLSATEDPRFSPVSSAELDALHIEISLLTVPVLLSDRSLIEIGRHGLMVSLRGRRGLLLPQVATEYGWSVEEFLAQTCHKAMLPTDAWQHEDVRVHTFETEIIEEATTR